MQAESDEEGEATSTELPGFQQSPEVKEVGVAQGT
jgi:hypothetical protein